MTARSSVIRNFELCWHMLETVEKFRILVVYAIHSVIWNDSFQDLHFLTWYASVDTKETSPSYGAFQGFLLSQASLYWQELLSPSEVNGNFSIGFCQQSTEHREEICLEVSYSDVLCPASGLWSITSNFLQSSEGLLEVTGEKHNFVLKMWSVLSLSGLTNSTDSWNKIFLWEKLMESFPFLIKQMVHWHCTACCITVYDDVVIAN